MVKPDFVIGLWLVFLLSEQFMVLALSKEELYLLLVVLFLRDSRYIVFPIPVPVFVFSGTRLS